MHRRISLIILVLVAWFAPGSPVGAQEQLFAVQIRHRAPAIAAPAPKLSSALVAIRDSGGVLKGAEPNGRLIFGAPPANNFLTAIRNSAAVEDAVIASTQSNWTPIRRLKLSYQQAAKPSDEELKGLGLRMIEDYQKGSFIMAELVDVPLDAKLVVGLQENPRIVYAAASYPIRAIPPSNIVPPGNAAGVTPAAPPTNDPMWPDLWGMQNIHAPIAWSTTHDSDVIVAVIDTGIDYTHPDLAANIWSNAAGKHGHDYSDNDDDPMDMNGHGTHCAGTIGAVGNNGVGVVGVNWKVKIMGVRWLDASGSGEIANAIKAIDFAVDNGARVLSNSWFWTEDDPNLQAAIARANAAHVLFVAAAGNFATRPNNNNGDNDNPNTYGRYPSAYPLDNIISVAAIDSSDQLASFSEWGKKSVDLGAPGVLIKSTVPHNGYSGTYSGTSMATPHVAGAAALAIMKDNDPAHFLQIKQALLSHARKVPALTNKCVSDGVLDISFLK